MKDPKPTDSPAQRLNSSRVQRILDKDREEWLDITRRIGVPNHLIPEVVQEAYMLVWRYANPDKIIVNDKVSSGYMYFTIRSAWLVISWKNKMESLTNYFDDGRPDEQMEEESGEYIQLFDRFTKKLFDSLHSVNPHYARLYKIYTSAENPSYRTLEKETGISYMTFFNDMKIVKEILDTPENREEWNKLNKLR